jgi:sulfur carrier protein
MTIRVNGREQPLPPDRSVADLLERLALPRRDVAVAVDGAVVPRSRWHATPVPDGAAVDVVTAVQGG